MIQIKTKLKKIPESCTKCPYSYVLTEMERLSKNDKLSVNFPIRLHSMNPVGVQNMRAIIKKMDERRFMIFDSKR